MFSKTLTGAIYPLLSMLGSLVVAAPTQAEVPLTWGHIKSSLNQAELVSSAGDVRRVHLLACLCAGDVLTTDVTSRAEVQFNDGSVARVGEQARFSFSSQTRNYQLSKGTVLLLVPPDRGRSWVLTPNAVTGIQDTAVVVRYVPSRNLTVVMALTNAEAGPVILTPNQDGRDYILAAGQMAFVNDTGIQMVEFDLQSFYDTSDLLEGLALTTPDLANPTDPLQMLRRDIQAALEAQEPLPASSAILDPATIRNDQPSLNIFGSGADLPVPIESVNQNSPEHYNDLPPGVVAPPPTDTNRNTDTNQEPETTSSPENSNLPQTPTTGAEPGMSDNPPSAQPLQPSNSP